MAALIRRRLDPGQGALLHVAAGVVAGDLAAMMEASGFAYRRLVLYRTRPAERLSLRTRRALANRDVEGVALYSPRTAATFVALVGDAGLEAACRALTAFCLSAAVTARINALDWARIVVARRPDQAAMIDAIVARAGYTNPP